MMTGRSGPGIRGITDGIDSDMIETITGDTTGGDAVTTMTTPIGKY